MYQTELLFSDKRKSIIHGLNDTKRTEIKQFTLILDSFTQSDMNFQKILMPKGILANFGHNKSPHLDHSYLKYALDTKKNRLHKVFGVKKM